MASFLDFVDIGPTFDGGNPNVDWVCDGVNNHQAESCMLWAKEVVQLCPLMQQSSQSRLLTDDPPCPCDRWCGDLVGQSQIEGFRSCIKPCSPHGLKIKTVSFGTTVDVFGFDPASPADAFPEEWWVDDVAPPASASQPTSPGVHENSAMTLDPHSEFWSVWCCLWHPVQQIIDSNGPAQLGVGCSGRFEDSFNDSSGQGSLKKEQRNEGGLAAGHPDPRLIDPSP